MKILALDLGKSKTMACVYDAVTGDHVYRTIRTVPDVLQDLIGAVRPDRVVLEISSTAGWVTDLVRALEIEVQVANTAHQAWRWRNVRKKNDRVDALKLAQLSAVNQLSLVHVPERRVRQWRSFISYRHQLVQRRTQIKNHIRAILDREALLMPAGHRGWTLDSLASLGELAKPLDAVSMDQLWRAELWMELRALETVEMWITEVEHKLDAMVQADARTRLLQTIPGVGPRMAEVVVAVIDDPHRFKNARQVGSYAGLTPRQYQSGDSDRQGKISGQGNNRLRSLLVEVSWIGLRYNPWFRSVYERVRRASPTRKKIAIVALARHLLIRCWAMLRDGTSWRPPELACAGART